MRIDWSDKEARVTWELGRVRCEPGWHLEKRGPTALHDYDLWFVWAGRGEMQTDVGDCHLRPGICVWMRPSGYYLAQQDLEDRLGVSFIHFSLYDADGNKQPYDAPAPPVIQDVADINFVDTTMRRIVELMRQPNRNPRDAAETCLMANRLMTGLLMDLDAASDRATSDAVSGTDLHHRKLVMELASRISESPKDVPPIAELADEAGYSADHFARVFKRVLGQSPQAYAVQAKINRACQLLTESPLTISQIADALGYEDIYFFSKQFRQKMNCTPTEYRKSGRRAVLGETII